MGLDVTEIISSLFPGKRAQRVFLFGQTVMAAMPVESVRVGGGEGGRRRRRAVLCLCFQRTVESTGGQRCLRGSAVTTHPVSLLQTPPHLPHPPSPSPTHPQQPPLWMYAVVLQSRAPPTCDRPPQSSSAGQRSQPCWPPVDPQVDPQVDPAGYLLCQLQKARIIQSHSH